MAKTRHRWGCFRLTADHQQTERQQQAEQLWQQHAAGIVRTLASYESDPHLREDLAQEIFCAIAQSVPRIVAAEFPRAYVYRIAHNVAVDHVARQVREKAEPHEPEQLAQLQEQTLDQANHCLAEQVQQSQQQAALMRAVRALAAPYRQVIVLLLEDLNANEIAEVLQISAGAVRVRINRAKSELRSLLQHEHG